MTDTTTRFKPQAAGLILAVVFVVALLMRVTAVTQTEVDTPLRADAAQYYLYAINLKNYGVYSLADNIRRDAELANPPSPDASRTPGYALFLLPFVDYPPSVDGLSGVLMTQAVLSALTVLLAYFLFRPALPAWGALLAAVLTGLSPHLIVANVYVLTETLFTFLFVGFTLALTRCLQRESVPWAVAAGLLLGGTMLVRPTLSYLLLLLVPALVWLVPWNQVKRLAPALVIGCVLVYSPWLARNALNVPDTAASTKAIDSVHMGMYPNVMFKDDPATLGYPDRHDPEWSTRTSTADVAAEITRRFTDEPLRHLGWYAIGKPTMFFSWNMVVGMGDAFIYPVFTSPYHTSLPFHISRQAMLWLHWPLTALALLTLIAAWIPALRDRFGVTALLFTRTISLIVAFFVLVHVAGLPLPRYAIPLRPLIYGSAMLGITLLIGMLRNRRGAAPAAS